MVIQVKLGTLYLIVMYALAVLIMTAAFAYDYTKKTHKSGLSDAMAWSIMSGVFWPIMVLWIFFYNTASRD